ncbi:venom carboxylesterase-6 isoform X2 [Halyomorpha halys]|uniref:venom carboxylesterase-6 isoform X2 n=1 Tax=Halyomorpha halys TaxID=286706 RepID=UPI0006D519EE|nr:venom carboxylesterase-6 isoform X2 [Halyomorpha halys]
MSRHSILSLLQPHNKKKSIAADSWYGVLNATREPPICLQYDFFMQPPVLRGSEDCLYINVYTPKLPGNEKNPKLLDVIALIHGGAFVIGTSVAYKPFVLLDRDILLVTFNYRLGPLGFFSTEDNIVPGNNGLKDQVLALQWIQKNIAAFGGNPEKVTVTGLSAGGTSCHFHTLSPLSKGLFKHAMCLSGIALSPMTVTDSKKKAKMVANELGCPTQDSLLMINCLRNRPAEHIVELTQKLLIWRSHPMVPYGPVIEPVGPDAFISEKPINIILRKDAADVPLIISFTSDEGLVGVTDIISHADLFKEFLGRWDELLPHMMGYNFKKPSDKMEISRKIREYYKIDDITNGRKNLVKMVSDRYFLAGISKFAKLHSSLYSAPMYIQKFSYRGKHSVTELMGAKENLGVCHGDDVYYTVRDYKVWKQFEDPMDMEMSKCMLDMWISFAANGTLDTNWYPVNKQLSEVIYTDIKGPNNFQWSAASELGEESFWNRLGLNENIEPSISRMEL